MGRHQKKELPALRAMLDLPFERVIYLALRQGPLDTKAGFEHALELPPFTHMT